MAVVKVQNLFKEYEFYRKQPGFLGTIKALFHREKQFARAVNDISFEIAEGEIVGFLGPNGAGKTTTLKMLSGILYPSSGIVDVLGYRPQQRKKNFKKQFGMVMGQKDQFARELPTMDNLILFKEFYEIPEEEFKSTVEELSKLLNVSEFLDIQVRKLSLGQRMKVELMAALLHKPKVLFLDEPTIGLDVMAQKNIREFIKTYNRQKKTTIILTSHYMDDIRELCERVIIINHGKILYDGKLADLITKYATEKIITVTFDESVALKDLEEFGQIEKAEEFRVSIRVPREKVKDVAARMITSDLPIDDILIDELSIDDIIRAIFEGH
jgi:ABC-2 type transport system ATP-binding protein